MHLLVKGSKFDAAKAASDRGIPFVFVEEIRNAPVYLETIGKVDKRFADKVSAWFTEPGDAPFPEGTLLYYHDDD
jgi:hypothetical protein